MSSIQNLPLLYQFIEKSEYEDALSTLETFDEQDIDDIYTQYKNKNCIHLLIDRPPNKKSEKLLSRIIKISEKFNQISKFQKSEPFQYALQASQIGHFDYLLKNRIDLLEDGAISKCLDLIVENNLRDKCKVLLKNFDERRLQWIFKPMEKTKKSPLIRSIEKNRICIFEIFIKHLTRIKQKENKETIIFNPQPNGDILLHSISRSPHATFFFQKLLQTKILRSSFKEENYETLFNEVIANIDKQNLKKQTPIFIATENGNEKMVQRLFEHGADLFISSAPIHLQPTNIKNFVKNQKKSEGIYFEKRPKNIAQNKNLKNLIEKAEYGLFTPAKNLPEEIKKIIQKRKETGLLRCCKFGKLEYAKNLIQNYGVNPYIKDLGENSLIMIMLQNSVPEKTIIKFIDFLVQEKKLDFKCSNKNQDNLLTLSFIKEKKDVAFHLIINYHKELDLNHSNKSGNTALMLAAKLTNSELLNNILKFDKEIDLNKVSQGKKALTFQQESHLKIMNHTKEESEKISEKNMEEYENSLSNLHKRFQELFFKSLSIRNKIETCDEEESVTESSDEETIEISSEEESSAIKSAKLLNDELENPFKWNLT